MCAWPFTPKISPMAPHVRSPAVLPQTPPLHGTPTLDVGTASAVSIATLIPGLGLVAMTAAPTHAADPSCVVRGLTITCTFTYTGAAQQWLPPADVTSATFEVVGAAGGRGADGAARGGLGGGATATLDLVGGQAVTINVGGKGADLAGAGGWNGGGNGASRTNPGGGGGGGASEVIVQGARRIVGGGGGGGGTLDSEKVDCRCRGPAATAAGPRPGAARVPEARARTVRLRLHIKRRLRRWQGRRRAASGSRLRWVLALGVGVHEPW